MSVEHIPEIVQQLIRRLETTREEFVFSVLSSLKGEGINVPGASKLLEAGTEVDSALCGFQLVVIVGFCTNYMDRSLHESFREALTDRISNAERELISRFREGYLDCEGDVGLLNGRLAEDVFRMWGAPEPKQKIVRGLEAAGHVLGILSQAYAAAAMGDVATESKLRGLVSSALP